MVVAEAKAGKDTATAVAEMITTTIVVTGGRDHRGSVERRVENAEEMIAETASRVSWMNLTIGGDVALRTGVVHVLQTVAAVVETMIATAIAIIVDRDTGAVVEVLLLVVVVAVAVVAVGPEVLRELECTLFSSQPITDEVLKRARIS